MTPLLRDDDLAAAAAVATDWLFGQAMPLWLRCGVDRDRGGFHETLDLGTMAPVGTFKRLRVTTRQIYVFAEGARHGVDGAQAAAEHGLDFLLNRMRHPAGGFASRCDLAGEIIDPTRDLYDLAFTLFALAHAHRLTGDPALRREAGDLLAFIDRHMRHPAGGFVEALPPRLPRRQNPHMHLLEAAIACAEHMPDPGFDRLCDELADLCERRFIDPAAGVLREYYADDLTPERVDGRAVTEPGHHFEWVWLLAELARVRGRTVPGAPALAGFALRHGLDRQTGLLRGELFDDGAIADPSVRLWPHGEWLKAALTMGDAAGAIAAWRALSGFLATPVPGLWFERWDATSATFTEGPAPATSLYHITTAVVALKDRAARIGVQSA